MAKKSSPPSASRYLVHGIAGPKKAVKAAATTGKSPRMYPADDLPPASLFKRTHNVSTSTAPDSPRCTMLISVRLPPPASQGPRLHHRRNYPHRSLRSFPG
mmetsp:Transcript_6212/g.13419  ORF Transcript_6212/g.13419 Transcript_6212/m.13419 type:complete len:101 (+) Transcript_6212:157-459(+)